MALSLKNIKGFIDGIAKKVLGNRANEAIYLAKIHGTAVKQAILNEIKNHELSKDLMSHEQSEYLNGRKGTLFGFLGFEANTNPVQELIDFLDDFWKIEPVAKFGLRGMTVDIKLKIVKPTDLKNAGLLLKWQPSLAWPYAVEGNISNLPFFLSIEKGRSLEGIQLKTRRKEMTAEFHGVDYISGIFRRNRNLMRVKKFKT